MIFVMFAMFGIKLWEKESLIKKVQLTQEEKGERDRCFNEYRTLSGYLARIEHFALA